MLVNADRMDASQIAKAGLVTGGITAVSTKVPVVGAGLGIGLAGVQVIQIVSSE